jgi:hypothetical protein
MDSDGHYRRKHARRAPRKCAQIELLKQFNNAPIKADSQSSAKA